MAEVNGAAAALCEKHRCCIRAANVEASPEFAHLAGEWHLRWIPRDRTWFLAPPKGNVWEIRVDQDTDPTSRLVVEGVVFDGIREAIGRAGLFPPC